MIWFRRVPMMKIHCFQRNLFVSSSSPLIPFQRPSRMETHFWYILPDEVKSASLLNQYAQLLSPCERENVFRLDGDELKRRALLARTLVRTTVAKYGLRWVCPSLHQIVTDQVNSQITPRSLKFRKNLYGKPEVEWEHYEDLCPLPLHFNISHTSSLIACGVTLDSPIGIDVEEKQRTLKHNILSFARRYFSLHEVEFLTTISDPEVQRQEFIKLWTLKESYVKALGRGFSAAPFKTFTVRFGACTKEGFHVSESPSSEVSEIFVESMDDPENLTSNWQFKLFELAGDHIAAICMQKDSNSGGKGSIPMKLKVWKTIPFVEDECVSGTEAVIEIL